MPTDDERLLTAEITRALARLRALRDTIEQLRDEGDLSLEARRALRAAGEFDRTDEG